MNALQKLQKKFGTKSQIGGKGTFRRKTKKASSLSLKNKPISLYEKRYVKIIEQINTFTKKNILQSNEYESFYNVFIKNQFNELFTNFKRKDYLKKKVIEEKDRNEFINLYMVNSIHSEMLLITNYKKRIIFFKTRN